MVNSVLSEALRVKPLKEGQTATFRLINSHTILGKYWDDETNAPIPSTPTAVLIPKQDSIYDPGLERTVIISNVVGYKTEIMPDKSEKMVPITEAIAFDNVTERTFTHEQNDTVAYLRRHRFNRDNPYRKSGGKVLYYEVNPQKEIQNELDRFDIMDEAKFFIRDCDMREIQTMAAILSEGFKDHINPNSPPNELRLALRKLVDTYEGAKAVLLASTTNDMKWVIQFKEAELYGVIEFDENLREWRHRMTEQIKEHKSKDNKACPLEPVICKVEVGKDQYKDFLEQLRENEDLKEHYRFIAMKLKKINEKTN